MRQFDTILQRQLAADMLAPGGGLRQVRARWLLWPRPSH
jgi:hypothetical protein